MGNVTCSYPHSARVLMHSCLPYNTPYWPRPQAFKDESNSLQYICTYATSTIVWLSPELYLFRLHLL